VYVSTVTLLLKAIIRLKWLCWPTLFNFISR